MCSFCLLCWLVVLVVQGATCNLSQTNPAAFLDTCLKRKRNCAWLNTLSSHCVFCNGPCLSPSDSLLTTARSFFSDQTMLKLSQSDALFPIQAEIWRHLGLEINTSKQALQEADMGTCLAAARAVCLSSVSV